MLEVLRVRKRMLYVWLTVLHEARCRIHRLRLLNQAHNILMSVCSLATALSLGIRRSSAESCTGHVLMDLLHGLTHSRVVELT